MTVLLICGFAAVIAVNLAFAVLLMTGVLPRYDRDLTARTRAQGATTGYPAGIRPRPVTALPTRADRAAGRRAA